jgi:hypothetical protein
MKMTRIRVQMGSGETFMAWRDESNGLIFRELSGGAIADDFLEGNFKVV